MKKLLVISGATVCAKGAICAANISDPIADFLSLPIENRYTDASQIVRVDRVLVDIDLDGQPELMIGHHKMWWGDNQGVYFAIYKKLASGAYQRLTRPDQDVGLVFRDGQPKFVFVGRVDEVGDTGLLVFNPPIGDAALKEQRTEINTFVSITSGNAKVIELPALDLTKDRDKAFFEKYSGQVDQQGGFVSESLTAEKLKELGYQLPDWTQKPGVPNTPASESSKSSAPTTNGSKLQAEAHAKTSGKITTKSAPDGQADKGPAIRLEWLLPILIAIGLLWLALKNRKRMT